MTKDEILKEWERLAKRDGVGMTKDEMLKERNRLSTEVNNDYDYVAELHWRDGFNAAMELIERERVKPLRDALERLRASLTCAMCVKNHKIANEALAQVEE